MFYNKKVTPVKNYDIKCSTFYIIFSPLEGGVLSAPSFYIKREGQWGEICTNISKKFPFLVYTNSSIELV